jgi:hypothetical protein
MQRRAFLTVLGVASSGGLGWILNACTDEETVDPPVHSGSDAGAGTDAASTRPPPTDGNEYVPGDASADAPIVTSPTLPNPTWQARAKALEDVGIYTEAAPGQWAGKERSHVPTIIRDTLLPTHVTVLVNHVMQVGIPFDAGTKADAATAVDGALGDASADADLGADAGDASDDADLGTDAAIGLDAAPPPADAAPPPGAVGEHYVTTIYVKTDAGIVAGLIEMKSSDPAPPSVTFILPAGTKSVTAYEHCNVHGLWASTPLAVNL